MNISMDGQQWELDLGEQSMQKLRAALEPFLPSGRSTPAASVKEVRAWAMEQGLAVTDRGRIPARITRRYLEAHSTKR